MKRLTQYVNGHFHIFAILVFLATCFVAISPVLKQDGWPTNHEFTAFSTRTQVYAEHLKRGDFFPIWYSGDANGYGTPSTFYYHKTFYYVSAIFLIATGSIKAAITIAVIFWLLVGAIGVYLVTRLLTGRRSLHLAAPLLFILGNYSFSDWLVRSAMAEFTAYMLIPYILYWVTILFYKKHFSYWIAPLIVILYFSHNIVAIVSLLVLAIAFVVYLLTNKNIIERKQAVTRSAIAAIGAFIVMTPYVIIYKIFSNDYNPASINEEAFLPKHQLISLDRYFTDFNFVWLDDYTKLLLQVDYSIWVSFVIGFVAVLIFQFKKRSKLVVDPYVLSLGISLAVFVFLQSEWALPVYDLFGFLNLLQFPWRLLTFIVPISLILTVLLWSKLADGHVLISRFLPLASAALIIITFAIGPVLKDFQYPFLGREMFAGGLDQKYMQNMTMGIGEYLPTYSDQSGRTMKSIDKAHAYLNETFYFPDHCSVDTKTPHFEPRVKTFIVTCDEDTKSLSLPQNFSRFSRVTNEKGQDVLFFRTPTSPLITVDAKEGENQFNVQQPRAEDLIGKLSSRVFADRL